MKINPDFAGTRLKEYNTTVSWRDTMNYAAAVGDENRFFFNDENPEGIISHPVYAAALTWPILGNIGNYLQSDTFPREVLLTQVHYTEHLHFHRPVVPGDKLTINGMIAAIIPHRAGTHVIIRLDAADELGKPVFVEHTGAMLKGVECSGNANGEESLPDTPRCREFKVTQEKSLHIGPLQPYIYDGCSDIFFPIHTSGKFARSVGLPGIILQGTATLAFAASEIINSYCDSNPGRLKTLFCRFTGMVLPGTGITIKTGHCPESDDKPGVFFSVLNNSGDKAISGGYAAFE